MNKWKNKLSNIYFLFCNKKKACNIKLKLLNSCKTLYFLETDFFSVQLLFEMVADRKVNSNKNFSSVNCVTTAYIH